MSMDMRSLQSEASLVPTVFRRHVGCLLDVPSVSATVLNLGGMDAQHQTGRVDECPFCHYNPEFHDKIHE